MELPKQCDDLSDCIKLGNCIKTFPTNWWAPCCASQGEMWSLDRIGLAQWDSVLKISIPIMLDEVDLK